jgi:hypothetical protein
LKLGAVRCEVQGGGTNARNRLAARRQSRRSRSGIDASQLIRHRDDSPDRHRNDQHQRGQDYRELRGDHAVVG